MNLHPTTVILSAESNKLDRRTNVYRTIELQDILRDMGLGTKQLLGVYKGKYEDSMLVPVTDLKQVDELANLAFNTFEQEAILVLNPDRTGYLRFANGSIESLPGRFTAIEPDEAKRIVDAGGSVSIDADQYYTFK